MMRAVIGRCAASSEPFPGIALVEGDRVRLAADVAEATIRRIGDVARTQENGDCLEGDGPPSRPSGCLPGPPEKIIASWSSSGRDGSA